MKILESAFYKNLYQRFIRIRGNPREIALGLALGLFIGFTPTMGAQIVIAVFFASLLKWNKITAIIGVHVTTPLTAPVIYGLTYWVGAKLMGLTHPLNLKGGLDWHHLVNMIDQAPNIFFALTIGGIVVGLPSAIIGYVASYALVDRYQKDLKEKLARKKEMLKKKIAQKKLLKRKSRQGKGSKKN